MYKHVGRYVCSAGRLSALLFLVCFCLLPRLLACFFVSVKWASYMFMKLFNLSASTHVCLSLDVTQCMYVCSCIRACLCTRMHESTNARVWGARTNMQKHTKYGLRSHGLCSAECRTMGRWSSTWQVEIGKQLCHPVNAQQQAWRTFCQVDPCVFAVEVLLSLPMYAWTGQRSANYPPASKSRE